MRPLLPFLLAFTLCACANAPAATPANPWQDLEVTMDVDSLLTDTAPIEIVTPEAALTVLSLEAAQASLPFAVNLPTNIPAGYALTPEVEVALPDAAGHATALLLWQDADENAFTLRVTNGAVALGQTHTAQAVTVQGQPATLAQSGSVNTTRWTLTWTKANLTYTLASADLAPEALKAIAESVP